MKIIDIGCGRKKIEGSIGIDNSPFSTADIILNLNAEPLPFESNSIDFVHSSHCLEHLTLEGFLHMLSEIFRVCKSDGIIYITVPYYTTALNFANPFHNNQICFNEHTFRFFSSAIDCAALSRIDYSTPSCPNYGLKHSANTDSSIELELVKIDYDYFPEYSNLSKDEQRALRASKINVVDIIHYWLKPVKLQTTQTIKKESLLSVDLNEYINKQLIYLDEQIEYIHVNRISYDFFEQNILKSKFSRKNNYLYQDNNCLLYTPNSMIGILSKIINSNQIIIDKSIEDAKKN